ncbi:MAG: bifunctional diaminohydroxyphosphoribosylaminopyrimidine deaminase/5-amino-6-(5-phosphoribosylamino)uracil reductase RibD [Bacteroidota bacterium]
MSYSPPSEQDMPFLVRTAQLARLGGVAAQPNPMVGAVVVYEGRIIGEGYHQQVGGPHAEVEAVNRVADKSLLAQSTIYVSLEPCNFHGRTPACTDLILRHHIPRVVVGSLDPHPKVSGKGLQKLQEAGVEIALLADQQDFIHLNKIFFVNQLLHRPFITLKWAESQDGFIGGLNEEGQPRPVAITGSETQRFSHRLRASHLAMLVGRITADVDQPSLTTRAYPGPDPIRLVWDPELKLAGNNRMLQDGKRTILLNHHKEGQESPLEWWKLSEDMDLSDTLSYLYQEKGVSSLLVEGGAHTLQAFIDAGLYDEIYRYTGPKVIQAGTPAPVLHGLTFGETFLSGADVIEIFRAKSYLQDS